MKRKTIFQAHKVFILIPLSLIFLTAFVLDAHANNQSDYQGLPPVPCVDSTKPIVQNFSVRITIAKNFNVYTLPDAIGHDAGNCLRVIHTNDSSGAVYITANDTQTYTIDDFFNVWRKNFGYFNNGNGRIQVYTNGKVAANREQTILKPGEDIKVVYISSK